MKKLNLSQLESIEAHIFNNGRDIEKAKWNYLFNKGSKEDIVLELLKYQNGDGGFGRGLEADMLLPASTSIASTEAIFIAYNYDLNCEEAWFKKLLKYFENTIQDTSSFWEKAPKEVDDFPHAPWWTYTTDTKFTPNPCAVIASAFIKYGDNKQKRLGNKIAAKCIDFLNSNLECSDHDCYCLQELFIILKELNSNLVDDVTINSMERRILECLCIDENRWTEYVPQPLDLVSSPDSQWHRLVESFIEKNFSFWLNTLKNEGFWRPNFSWGTDSEISSRVTEIWSCHMAVKRVKIFKDFGLVEI
ncbi:MAG: hypothetical protein ACLSV2_00150 [Clostridium sp.]